MQRPWIDRQREALREIRAAITARVRAEANVAQQFEEESQKADADYLEAKQATEDTNLQRISEAQNQADLALADFQSGSAQQRQAILDELARAKDVALRTYDDRKNQLLAEFKEARWTANTVSEADKKVAKDLMRTQIHTANEAAKTLAEVKGQFQAVCNAWGIIDELVAGEKKAPPPSKDPHAEVQQILTDSRTKLAELEAMKSARMLRGLTPWLFVTLAWLLLSAPAIVVAILALVNQNQGPLVLCGIWLGAVVLIVPLVGYGIISRYRARDEDYIVERWQDLVEMQRRLKVLVPTCVEKAKESYEKAKNAANQKMTATLENLSKDSKEQLSREREACEKKLQESRDKARRAIASLDRSLGGDQNSVEQEHVDLLTRTQEDAAKALSQVDREYHRQREEINRRHAQAWTALYKAWKAACEQFVKVNAELSREYQRWFGGWKFQGTPGELPLGLPFGRMRITPEELPNSQPEDAQLPKLELGKLDFPATLPFPERASLLMQAHGEGKAHGIRALEAILLRCWLSLPPGKVRTTLIDPVGRGEHFSAFMHLGDIDESLIHGRIWTESSHIDQRLADLTGHMENVLQKYLRNQFETLAQYNATAGETAEPFRFLIVANFPVNFSDNATRRLISIASAGARCGIYTFILLDKGQPLPPGVNLAELERVCTCLYWQNDHFEWEDEDFGPFPLELSAPPPAKQMTELIQKVGEETERAAKVEVPFEVLLPQRPDWWKSDSKTGIAVPLGRVGARGQQLMELGRGTSQHVLIAGKTGSGKSTLLHVLITQLALRYSPHEVELYLIDFKKGVEFKNYASLGLPHARVIAVESEREFGLSVLQRLDVELTRRGELFRSLGVSDLAGYREAAKGDSKLAPMPRILLIVDEFQEFFVEDDKLAQECSLLMDRLVRQGRAFGIHIILGSQTLGGAFSLARSTIDQMAVRIALQCSEADAHLILSRENTEARLLSRPGEAIYNASHGQLEGNHLFQVVWLADGRRDELVKQVHVMGRAMRDLPRPIVFEGNAPADLANNGFLRKLIQDPGSARGPWLAWLGDAIAIKDPTAAVFRRQSGANLLMLGQNEDTALALMLSTMLSVSARVDPNTETTVTLILGAGLDEPADSVVRVATEQMGVRSHTQRELAATLAEYAAEVDQRMKTPSNNAMFLILYGLQRLRDLRKAEDDFGFSRKGEEKPNPHKLFMHILKEGPTVGVHVLVWCDTLTNLQRSVDRQGMREFDLRVLMQMSANDSSTLIDNPIASKLGAARALYYTEEHGRMEKFRPYALPSVEALRELLTPRLASTATP